MKDLPLTYQEEMKELLEEEYSDYMESLEKPYYRAFRINTLKVSEEDFLQKFSYGVKKVPWCDSAYYFEDESISKHPYWYAGLYYLQEPSALLPGASLPIALGDRVLDLCAAPGGKSTQLAAKLQGTGILVSNDYSVSRSQILLRNLERAGCRNSFVVSEDPAKLSTHFEEYFDKILVDAPCSGEGMFRKDPTLITSWQQKGPEEYAKIQKDIVKEAVKMLKKGGQMVYSTCTFSIKEDEEVIQYILSLDPQMKVIPLPYHDGFVQNAYGTKLFPHRIEGEGHFVSLLQKGDVQDQSYTGKKNTWNQEGIHASFYDSDARMIKDKEYMVPDIENRMQGLRVLRSGLLLAEHKKNRIELEQALAMALRIDEMKNYVSFAVDDNRILRYLKGETLDVKDCKVKDGWCLVCVDDYPLGFGKVKNGVLKNKLEKSWIYQGK